MNFRAASVTMSPGVPNWRLICPWSCVIEGINSASTPAALSAATNALPCSLRDPVPELLWKTSIGGMPLPAATCAMGEASFCTAGSGPNAAV
jgi:hypothetical protein